MTARRRMIRKIVTVLILVPLALADRAVRGREPRAGECSLRSVRRRAADVHRRVPLFWLLLVALIVGRHRRRRRGLVAPEQVAPPRAPPVRRPEGRACRDRGAAPPSSRCGAAAQAQPQTSIAAIAYRHPSRAHDPMRVVTGRRDRPRPHLSGADRGAARGVPRRHRGRRCAITTRSSSRAAAKRRSC